MKPTLRDLLENMTCWAKIAIRWRLMGGEAPLDCWLRTHPKVANSIKWQFKFESSGYSIPESAKLPWAQWSPAQRTELVQTFNTTLQWLKTPGPFGQPPYVDAYPPTNVGDNVAIDGAAPWVEIDEQTAWTTYVRWIALNLALEWSHELPWSLHDYDAIELQVLFDSAALMSKGASDSPSTYSVCSGMPQSSNYLYRKDNLGDSLPAPPYYTLTFLQENGLIGATPYETIANLLQWVADNCAHFNGGDSYGNMEDHWQYRGIPPIPRIIEGTAVTSTGQFEHWTAGCHGTSGFIRNVLRAANIPVHIVKVCGHNLVHFLTEDLYLDHGDDPYNSTFKATGLPASALLIDAATYEQRFGPEMVSNIDDHCEAIGQQVQVLSGG